MHSIGAEVEEGRNRWKRTLAVLTVLTIEAVHLSSSEMRNISPMKTHIGQETWQLLESYVFERLDQARTKIERSPKSKHSAVFSKKSNDSDIIDEWPESHALRLINQQRPTSASSSCAHRLNQGISRSLVSGTPRASKCMHSSCEV